MTVSEKKISSIVIAKNEERNILRCLESQSSCIDDIVVIIDDSTTDNTVNIVKSFGKVNFEIVKWRGFSDTKKYALSKTKYDWVFWIDADEEITNELARELVEFKKNPTKADAYSVARRAFFLGKWIKHSGWYPNRVTRLFNKYKAHFSVKNVHEHLVVDGKTGKLLNDLNHYTDPDIYHYFEKFNNYTTLAAQELTAQNKKAKLLDIILRPLFLFVKMYIFKLGFLDGIQGFILAVFSAAYVFTKYSKIWEIHNVQNKVGSK